jgi:GAF domain-containing protein
MAPHHDQILTQIKTQLEGERDWVANTANVSAIIYRAFNQQQPSKTNWVGFYILKGSDLVLGPFHGMCRDTIQTASQSLC